jgi:AcrR family transcriptional regulator
MTVEMLVNAASRVSYTEEAIKDAFLNLLKCKDYMDITVTDICKTAGVSRGTFYAHFDNIAKLTDTLFEEVLSNVGNIPLQYICLPGNSQNDGLPLCMFLRKNKKYQPLFFSSSLRSSAIGHTVDALLDGFLSVMKDKTSLSDSQLEDLLYMQITDCIMVCLKHIHDSDEEWEKTRYNVDAFLTNGFCHLRS